MKLFVLLFFLLYFIDELKSHAKVPTIVKFNIRIKKPDKNVKALEKTDGRRSMLQVVSPPILPSLVPHLVLIRPKNATDTLNYPYIAAIIINRRFWCAGAIVDVSWILTAAHCLNYVLHIAPMKSLRKYVKVRVGSTTLYEDGALIDVLGAVRHPKFEEEPVPHADIALLQLAQNLVFSKYVALIKIYAGMQEPFPQSYVTIPGWGAVRGDLEAFRDRASLLQAIRLKVRTQHYCADSYAGVNGFQFTEDFFCASFRNGTRDACLFDAGAPAVQKNRLMGVMSFGPEKCGMSATPAVFIKAFYFRDFVRHTIRAHKTSKDILEALDDQVGRETPPIHRPSIPPKLRGGNMYNMYDDRSSDELVGPEYDYRDVYRDF